MRPVPLLLLSLPLAPSALACGQSTHIWVGVEAVDWLPDGPLRDLLSRDELFAYRVNGAMFPDGGYSPITQDGYGESAHWEPFQTAYLEWIKDRWDPPYDGDAAPHIAFLMGLAAHGMADQIYDGVYLTRSLLYDGAERWSQANVDLATDVAMTARVGPQPFVDDVVPYDALVEVFDRYGQPTSPDVMRSGQTSLQLAVRFTSNAGQDPEQAATYEAQIPWANGNLDDPAVFCSPACIQPAVAAYWQILWARLNDTFDPTRAAVFASWPPADSYGHPRAAADIESQVSVGLSRAVDLASLTPERVAVTNAAGEAHPIGFRMYYGDRSNVLNVWPTEDWAEDEDYTLSLGPGIVSFDGQELEDPVTLRFSTRTQASSTCGGCTSGASPGWMGLLALLTMRRRR